MKPYAEKFYSARHAKTLHSANAILSILLEKLPAIASAVDVGCGVGTWLAVLKEKGVKEIFGIDGTWVNQDLLVIRKEFFRQLNLGHTFNLSKRYDLVMYMVVCVQFPT